NRASARPVRSFAGESTCLFPRWSSTLLLKACPPIFIINTQCERALSHAPIIWNAACAGRNIAVAQMIVTPVATHGLFVDGRWIEEGDIVEVKAPFDGALIGRVYQGTRKHAEAAIAAAVKAFGTTRRLPAFERQRILRQISQGIAARKEEFSRTLAQESGKPSRAARTGVERAVFTITV